MPFGVGSCEDNGIQRNRTINPVSPMPFGVGSCEDRPCPPGPLA